MATEERKQHKRIPGGLARRDRLYGPVLCLVYLSIWLVAALFIVLGVQAFITPTMTEQALSSATCVLYGSHIVRTEDGLVRHIPCAHESCKQDDLVLAGSQCGFGVCVQLRVNASIAGYGSLSSEVTMPSLERYSPTKENVESKSIAKPFPQLHFGADDFLLFGFTDQQQLTAAYAERGSLNGAPLAGPPKETRLLYSAIEAHYACSLLDCRQTAAEAEAAASVLAELYSSSSEEGASTECWHVPGDLDDVAASRAAELEFILMPIILRRAHPVLPTVLVSVGFSCALFCTVGVYCFLLCREWCCQFDWARRYQYF